MDTELVGGSKVRVEGNVTRDESSSNRARDELEHEKAKKQKVDDDKKREDLQQCFEIVLEEEEIAIDAIPLATITTHNFPLCNYPSTKLDAMFLSVISIY
ncbi:hypothetical protein Tco_1542677 [Tanacetum coccineum]